MRNTRLYIYKEPIIHNTSISYTPVNGGGYYDEWWTIPSATTFAIYGMIPYADDLAGTYAIHQNFGLDDVAIVKIGVVVDADTTTYDGAFDVGVGNSHYTIVQPGTYIFTFDVTSPDATFNFDIVVHGSGGAYLGGNPVSGMGIKEIYLISTETQQYKEVDLYDNLDIPITYNVADVQDITKKDSNFSLTVQLPNTANNALLFDQVKDIAVYGGNFEMLKQYPAFVEVDGNRTFEGYLQITKVVTNDDQEVIYECNLYSNFVEFVSRLNTTTLRGNANPLDDLSFSEYTKQLTVITDPSDPNYPGEWFNHTSMYIWDTSTTPWTKIGERPYGEDFYFAPVDKYWLGGRNSVTSGGDKYVPLFFDEITPFLFYKEIWDKIFKQAGFSYVSDFIENTANNTTTFQFDHLVYPSANLHLGVLDDNFSILTQDWISYNFDNNSQYTDNTWQITDGSFYFNHHFPIYGDQHNTGSITTTQMNCYNGVITSSDYTFTATQGGNYSVKIRVPWRVEAQLTNGYGTAVTQLTPFYAYCNNTDNVASSVWRLSLIWQHNGVNYTIASDTVTPDWDAHNGSGSNYWNVTQGGVISDFIPERLFSADLNIFLEAGDTLSFRYYFDYTELTDGLMNMSFLTAGQPASGCGLWFTMKCVQLDYLVYGTNRIVDIQRINDLYIGGNFDPTIILNPNTKKVDFLNNIIKKFNLYVEDVTNKKDANGVYYRDYTSPNVRKGEPILKIEPRPLYYSNNQVVRDWTDRVDISTMEFNRIDDYLYKRLFFNDKNDKTWHTEDYANYNYVLGEYGEQIVTSPFNVKEDEKVEVLTDLGQTMCGRVQTADVSQSDNTYTQCPYIYTSDNSGGIKVDKEYNDRMLFVYDLYWNDYTRIWNDSQLKGWMLYSRNNSQPNQFTPSFAYNTPIISYCLLDTFNAPFGSETADLNFGGCMWYYQNLNGTWATDKNCYNVFYADMVESYNDPSARLLKCNIYLSPSDIRDLQLSDTIILNNMAYHINKIDQWKNGEEPCKVELIKIIDSQSTTPISILRQNNPPKLDIVTPSILKGEVAELSKDVVTITKVVEDNKTELATNSKAIEQIEQILKNFDERLKKLEG